MRYRKCSKCGMKCGETLSRCLVCATPLARRITKADIGAGIDFQINPDWKPTEGVIEDVSRGFVFVRYYAAEAKDGRRVHNSEGFTTFLQKSSDAIIAVH